MSQKLTISSTLPLPSGGKIPIFGFGTCQSTVCTQACLHAMRYGYRHLDTAQIYQNEHETGVAIKQSTVPHSDLFVCSKLWEKDLETGKATFTREGAIAGVESSLKKLQLDVIDLYLLHVPRPGSEARHQAWLGLQDCMKQGKVKAIGVSNFSPNAIEALMKEEGVDTLPAVNQIEFHPFQQQKRLLEYCKSKGIVVVAYSPLSQGTRLQDPVIVDIAKKANKTPAQVALRWCLQKGVVIIPKSDREERIKENAGIFGWSLEDKDMHAIDALDEGQKGNIGEWDPYAWES